MRAVKASWDEVGSGVAIDKKAFYRMLKLLKKHYRVEVTSYTGKKPKI